MAIKILKKPVEVSAPVVVAPEVSVLAAQIDEIGKLHADIVKAGEEMDAEIQKACAPIKDKLDKLKKKQEAATKKLGEIMPDAVTGLLELHEDDDPDTVYVEKGTKYQADLSKKGKERKLKEAVEVDIDGVKQTLPAAQVVKELLGDEVFWALAKINIGDLDKYLTEPQRDEVLNTNRTARKVTFAPKV